MSTETHAEAMLAEARALAAELEPAEAGDRLRRSVVRPLEAAGFTDGTAPAAGRRSPEERLLRLAEAMTRRRARPHAPAPLIEATAALQDLAVAVDGSRLEVFEHVQAHLGESITLAPRGPYLATNVTGLADWLGVPVATRPQLALCRCGASKSKPLCDGSHAEIGFDDGKDAHRVADRRDTYPGLALTILDNRGLCAHSGFCTDGVPTVFHAGSEPFVTPSGGRMDEIVRAVRACPSGALSFAVDGREAREEVDQPRAPAIEISKDGPYRVTGSMPLLDADGEVVERNEGASLEHYSLCRCGKSQNKPFCSGMHWYAEFHDPPPPADREPTLFEWVGGYPALLRMTRIFYARYVPEEPLLAPLFAGMSPDHPERVAAWLSEVFGGPDFYSQRYGGYARMIGQHLNRSLTEAQRARWVQLLSQSADDAGLPADPEFRAAFAAYLEWGSRIAKENSTPGAEPPPNMPVPRWWWVCDALPDARRSALAPHEDETPHDVTLPGPGRPVGFEAHVKQLFRESDRRSMRFAFDLWDHNDVATNAEPILDRLRAGTMPCDKAWPQDWIELFARWVEAGTPA